MSLIGIAEPCSPVVQSWGPIGKTIGGPVKDSGKATITLFGDALSVPGNSTTELTIRQWFNRLNIRQSQISIYQWNELSSTQEVIFKGYIEDIEQVRWERGVLLIDLRIVSSLKSLDQEVLTEVITREAASYPNAPKSSEGLMPPSAYGVYDGVLFSGADRNSLPAMCFPTPGMRGVVVDENQATAKLKVRFGNHDGVSPSDLVVKPDDNDPRTVGDLWIWDDGMQAYGMVNSHHYTLTNNNDILECVIDAAPTAYFYLKPSIVGSRNSSGFTDIHKLIDSDPTNYVISDNVGNHIWAFDCPVAQFGGKVTSVSCVVDVSNFHGTKQRSFRYGLWDVYASGGANWLSPTVPHSYTMAPSAARAIRFQDTTVHTAYSPYVSSEFRGGLGAGTHLGSSTQTEMASGRFITRDTSDVNEANLQLCVEVAELGGLNSGRDGVKVYGISMCVQVEYPYIPRYNSTSWIGPGWRAYYSTRRRSVTGTWNRAAAHSYGAMLDSLQAKDPGEPAAQARQQATERMSGTAFFIRGRRQQDDSSGTFTGTPDGVIWRPCDVAHHILANHGATVNTNSGELGNFVDPRTYGVGAGYDLSAIGFGPEGVAPLEAIEVLNDRFPQYVFEEDGVMHCIPDDMNPHSSRLYGGLDSQIPIVPGDFDTDTFRVDMIPFEQLRNRAIVRYGHGFPDREPTTTTIYEHPLSKKYYGLRPYDKPIDEPFLVDGNLSSTPQLCGTTHAQWLGRLQALPRMTIPALRLSQAFYDLKRGHVLKLLGLDKLKLRPTSLRSGLVHHYFAHESTSADRADSYSFEPIILGTLTALHICLPSQASAVTFSVAVASAYTSIADAWKYSTVSGWTAFGDANTTNKDALKSTGLQTVSVITPRMDLWAKVEQNFAGLQCGPGYWMKMDYDAGTVAGLVNAPPTTPDTYDGYIWEVLAARRVPTRRPTDYQGVEVTLMQTM